jgi:hypothetical protein
MLNINSLIPAIAVGIGLGTVIFYMNSPMGDEIFHAFASHHKKRGGGYGGGGGGGHGYKGDRGFYTAHGHHHCRIGSPGCICTDPSKCRVGSTGGHGSGGGGEHRYRHSKQHHITGTPVRRRHHSVREEDRDDEFEPSDFDFEHVFESPHRRFDNDGNLSI